ncbi:MAG: asparagine synthetase B, partial [Actinomycetia bacterium]|nr:asparagine synthetase B [Actinomycetes bacterium]
MSGIAGWVDFTRDIDRQPGVVRSMVATLANRGPDGERVWAAGHAVLGHRRLAVPGSMLGAQPAVAEQDDRVLGALAFDGEVYNAAALRSRLLSAGHRIPGDDHAHVLLHAYLEWGDSFPDQIEGTFAIAVWDARTEEVLLARDHFGVKPLYYTLLPTGVVFGSEPKAVLAHPLVEAVADADTLREAMAFTATPGNGLFVGLRKVTAGSTTRVAASGTKDHTFWELTAAPHTDDERTTVATVRGLMEEAVGRQLLAHGETSV